MHFIKMFGGVGLDLIGKYRKMHLINNINNRYSHNFNIATNETGKENVEQIVSYTKKIVNNLDQIVKGDVKIEE